MGSRRAVFPVLVLVTLLGLPSESAAGPIDFSYRVYGNTTSDSGQLDPGPVTFSLDAGGNVGWMSHSGSMQIGTVRFGMSPGPQAADSYTASARFKVAVAVTDQMTGASIDLVLPGGAVDTWDYRSWDGRWMNSDHRLELGDSFAGNASETSARLGHVRYTLRVDPADDNQAGVYTLAATVTNPEPGTLALGLLALVPVGVRAVRGRRTR